MKYKSYSPFAALRRFLNRSSCCALVTGATVVCSIPTFAQTTADKDSGDSIVLSPFEVRESAANGYLAAESTTGTRYAVATREVPFPVNVVTSDFIQNFLAFDFSDAVAYTSSTGVSSGTAAFNLRGIRNNTQYKNGIREGGLYSPIDIDRIELIKGANAAIYGQTEPTGLRNIVTKTAKPTPDTTVFVNTGTDDFYRFAFDSNQPLIKGKLFTRFTASTESSKQYVQDFGRFWRRSLYNSTVWRISPATSLTTHWEYIKFRNYAQGASNLPFILSNVTVNGTATTAVTGILGDTQSGTDSYRYLNYAGPLGYNQVEYNQLDATLSHKFNDVLSLRVLGSAWNRPSDIVRPNATTTGTNATFYNASTGQLLGSINPRLERNRERANAFQADLLAQFATGPVKHKLLLTADYFWNRADARQRMSSRKDAVFALSNVFTNGTYYNSTFPYAFDFFNTEVWDKNTSDQVNWLTIKGLFLSERASFFHDRLLVMGGVRHDESQNSRNDHLNQTTFDNTVYAANTPIDFNKNKANSPQAAAVYKVTSAISAYTSWSRSFNVQSISATNIDMNGNPLPVQRGSGVEFGVKAALLDERLNFTLGYYDIDKTNVPRVARDAAGNAILISGTTAGTTRQYSELNDINSHGVELDLNWRFTDDFSMTAGLGWNHARYTRIANPTEQYLLGVPPDNAPEWGGGLSADYKFSSGWLKGFSLRAGWRYQGTQLVNSSTASIFGNSRIKGPQTTIGGVKYDTYYFTNHAYSLVDFGIGYSWRTGRFHHRISLDIKNLFDEHYLNVQAPGLIQSANFGYQAKF
jgi:outer membrane receptor protein involved in Fe transport